MVTPRLTDDEVVAIVTSRAAAYVGPLPTIDTTSIAEMGRAVYRGNRSLVVRSLLDEHGVFASELKDVADVLSRAPRFVSVHVGSRTLERTLSDVNFVYYPDGAGCVVEGVSAAGVHDYLVTPRDRAKAQVRELILAAGQSPPADDTSGLVVTRATTAGVEFVFAGRDGISRSVASDQANPRWSALEPNEIEGWLEAPFASA